jgi:hypothetical protein
LPIIVAFLVCALTSWYMAQKVDSSAAEAALLEAAVAQGRMTQAALDEALVRLSEPPGIGAGIAAAAQGGVMALILALLIAGYGKLFSKLAKAENRYKSLLEVSLYATVAVGIVSLVVTVAIFQLKGVSRVSVLDAGSIVASNLGALIDIVAGTNALPKFVMGLAQTVDIFYIWMIALLAIGFSAVSKGLKTSTAAIWIVGAYVICAVIYAAIQALLAAVMGGMIG